MSAFLSGAAALGYQAVWSRNASMVLGHEAPAMVGTVAGFFLGAALGAFLFERFGRRWGVPWVAYVGAEMAIAGWAWAGSALLSWWAGWRSDAGSVWGAAGVALIALPATVAMGATFPALERLLAGIDPGRRWVGWVYGANTIGAVVGVIGASFVLMPSMGLESVAQYLSLTNIAAAFLAWWGVRRTRDAELAVVQRTGAASPSAEPSGQEPNVEHPTLNVDRRTGEVSGRRQARVGKDRGWENGLGLGLVGFLGVFYEVLGFRWLSQTLENSVYTFSSALAVYLLGSALGGLWAQRGRPLAGWLASGPLALGCAASAVAGWMTFPVWSWVQWPGGTPGAAAWVRLVCGELAVSGLLFFCFALFNGALFVSAVERARRPGAGVGVWVSWNALGGAFGAGGVLLLPAFGLGGAGGLLCLGYAVLAWVNRRVLGMMVVGLALWAWLGLPSTTARVERQTGARTLNYQEGLLGCVTVTEGAGGERTLRVNQRFQMGSTAAWFLQERQAHLPLLLHARPERALFLGPGTGITVGAATTHPGLEIEAVEILEEVVAALPLFAARNREAHRNPRVKWHVADARRWLRRVGEGRFDVIVGDVFHPGRDGAGALYTTDHFRAARDRLAEGGLFCQWLPVHQLDDRTFRLVTRSFLEVFPEAEAWLLHWNIEVPVVGLLGRRGPGMVYAERWLEERESAAPEFREAVRGAGFSGSLSVLGCRMAGASALRQWAGAGPLNTDDRPLMIYWAPWAGVSGEGGGGDAFPRFRRGVADPAGQVAGLLARVDTPFGRNLGNYVRARDRYLEALEDERSGRLGTAFEGCLEAARTSVFFTPAYARCVGMIQVMARTDLASARRWYDRLLEARPDQPLGERILGPLFAR